MKRVLILIFATLFLIGLCFFYFKYIPLLSKFQMILFPFLLVFLVVTLIDIKSGVFLFVFFFPLINNLPYFFGIDQSIPHAPTALILCLVLILGWLIHGVLFKNKICFSHPIFRPLSFFSLVLSLSAIITFFRYTNFFPFFSDGIYELVVNVNGVRAGGALMSLVFNFLNYMTAFIFFLILFNVIKSKNDLRKLFLIFSISIFFSICFALVQLIYSSGLGNTPIWTELNRINSTFKDPNSFAVVLSSSLPLFFGLVLYSSKMKRILFIFLIFLGLFVFPATGSRSGFLGIAISAFVFLALYLMSNKSANQNKIKFSALFIFLFFALLVCFILLSRKSILQQRIGWSLNLLQDKVSVGEVFTKKLDFWRVASHMIAEYPLSGVGMGAFIIELPNYLKAMDLPFRHTDSAENYFFQLCSETGLGGLFLFLWLFFVILTCIRKNWLSSLSEGREKFLLIGGISGLASILVNCFFHSYIGAFEAKYFFWLLIFLTTSYFPLDFRKAKRKGFSRVILLTLVIIFIVSNFWNSARSLSVGNRQQRFGWEQDFGFYKYEKGECGIRFRWAREKAGLALENVGKKVVIPLKVSNPDLRTKPVSVRIFQADKFFRKRELIKEIIFEDEKWMNHEFEPLQLSEPLIYLLFEADRSWSPKEELGVPDPRKLSFCAGDFWFKEDDYLSGKKIRVLKSIPREKWEGRFRDKLRRNGVSKIKFVADGGGEALRLSIRGKTACGIGPYLVMRLNNRVVDRVMLETEKWDFLIIRTFLSPGENTLSVELKNDYFNPGIRENRVVFLGGLEIIKID